MQQVNDIDAAFIFFQNLPQLGSQKPSATIPSCPLSLGEEKGIRMPRISTLPTPK